MEQAMIKRKLAEAQVESRHHHHVERGEPSREPPMNKGERPPGHCIARMNKQDKDTLLPGHLSMEETLRDPWHQRRARGPTPLVSCVNILFFQNWLTLQSLMIDGPCRHGSSSTLSTLFMVCWNASTLH
jgi:hypothetical protein